MSEESERYIFVDGKADTNVLDALNALIGQARERLREKLLRWSTDPLIAEYLCAMKRAGHGLSLYDYEKIHEYVFTRNTVASRKIAQELKNRKRESERLEMKRLTQQLYSGCADMTSQRESSDFREAADWQSNALSRRSACAAPVSPHRRAITPSPQKK